MNLIPVEGRPGLYRNSVTNVIVNKNEHDYNVYVQQREKMNDEKQRIKNLESDVKIVKDDLSEIKTLLRSLINEPK